MDVLILGIDGGDRDIVDAMDMPFTSSLLDTGYCMTVKEDLWSRGWASILNGAHGRDTGAFYSKPKLDGGYGFTQSFGTKDHQQAPVTPLWELAEEAGYTVGFMNPPTTVTAPDVNGFFVSGAGGGYSPADGIPPEACSPTHIHKYLSSSEYRWETRFRASGIRDFEEFLEEITETVSARSDAYLSLCDEFEPGFGMFVQKESVVVQNLLMSEIEKIMMSSEEPNTRKHELIRSFYRELDTSLQNVVNELDPETIMLVSDHGQSRYLYNINLNAFLQEIDVQQPASDVVSKPKELALSLGRNALPNSIKQTIKSTAPSAVESIQTPPIDWSNSLAFTSRYVPGIYINDEQRFDGPVATSAIEETVDTIIKKFNATEEATQYELFAERYRAQHANAYRAELLPDIWIEHDDTMFFEPTGKFIEENSAYGTIDDLSDVNRDMHTGIKGETPILCLGDPLKPFADKIDSTNCSAAYEVLSNYLDEFDG